MTIRNLIFDLGGVILNIDSKRIIESFKKLGATTFPTDGARNIFSAYGKGEITTATLRKTLMDELDIMATDTEFDKAWNSELVDIPQERFELIKRLKESGYRIYLFSNTNELHYEKFLDICRTDHGITELKNYFDREYYSHLFKKRKPDPGSFTAILAENDLQAEETLFIDDTLENVQGAESVGLHTFHVTEANSLLNIENYIEKLNQSTQLIELETSSSYIP